MSNPIGDVSSRASKHWVRLLPKRYGFLHLHDHDAAPDLAPLAYYPTRELKEPIGEQHRDHPFILEGAREPIRWGLSIKELLSSALHGKYLDLAHSPKVLAEPLLRRPINCANSDVSGSTRMPGKV